MNTNIANFTKDVKPVSIGDGTTNNATGPPKEIVTLQSSSDDDSMFGIDSSTPSKKSKVSNSK